MELVITDLEKMIRQELENEGIIQNYIKDEKANFVRPEGNVVRQLSTAGQTLQYANNTRARIRFATIAQGAILDHFASLSRKDQRSAFFLTLTPKRFAMPLDEAWEFEPEPLRHWVGQHLGSFHYFGMIEAALYPRYKLDAGGEPGAISWHVHALIWGSEKQKLVEKLEPLCDQNESLLHGVKPYHLRKIKVEVVDERLLYCLKSPQNQYITFSWPKERIDPVTGEISSEANYQRKAILRPGQRIQMCNVLRYQHLDQLLVAGGDGADVCREICDAVLRPLRLREELGRREFCV
jgi:hypothetical protein